MQNKAITSEQGMTLIETLVVMAILALVLGLGIGAFRDVFGLKLEKNANQIARLVAATYGEAAVKNRYYRLAIDLDQRKIVVESSENRVLIDTSPVVEEEPTPAVAEDATEAGEVSKVSNASSFTEVSSRFIQPIQLPEGIKLKNVFLAHEGKVERGKVYLYFFPNGWVEKGLINLVDENEKNFYSVEIHSLSGKSKILPEYRELEFEKE